MPLSALRPNIFLRACPALFLLLLTPTGFSQVTLEGRVTQAASLAGIENALVTADAPPFDGTPEHTSRTGPFGFYTLNLAASGNWRITMTHPAYVPDVTDANLTGDSRLSRGLALQPGGESRFDVFAQVGDVKSGLMLRDVPVTFLRFENFNDTTAVETRTEVTDVNGFVTFVGCQAGFYRFRANDVADGAVRQGWQSYTTLGTAADQKQLIQAHSVLMQLKPVSQNLTVQVRGLDPRQGESGLANQPLKNLYLELTGVHPDDHSQEIVPARTGASDAAGQVAFQNLWGIHWRLRVKHAGYEPLEHFITTDASDMLPAGPLVTNVTLQPTALKVRLTSAYQRGDLMTNLTVNLTGLTNTETAGIHRQAASTATGDGFTTAEASALFSNLLPGRYRISVNGTNTSQEFNGIDLFTQTNFTAVFAGAGSWEAAAALTNVAPVELAPRPAHIDGILWVAEQSTEMTANQSFGSRYFVGGQPLYEPRGDTNITFRESANAYNLTDIFAIPRVDAEVQTPAADDGSFSIDLLPGCYGIRLPGMAGYLGYGVRVTDLETGVTTNHAWPYDLYRFDPGIPFPFTSIHGLGQVFHSGGRYQLELLVRKQVYNVAGNVKGAVNNPAQVLRDSGMVYSDLASEGMLNLTHPDTSVTQVPLGRSPGDNNGTFQSQINLDGIFVLHDLPSGAYQMTPQHPRHTFTLDEGGAPPFLLDLPVWGEPGVIEADDSTQVLIPMDELVDLRSFHSPPFRAVFAPPAAGVTVVADLFTFNTTDSQYELNASDVPPDTVSPPWDPQALILNEGSSTFTHFSTGTWTVYWHFNGRTFSASIEGGTSATQHKFNIRTDGPSVDGAILPGQTQFRLTAKAVSSLDPSLVIPAQIQLDATNTVTSPFDSSTYSGDIVPDSVTHPQWALDLSGAFGDWKFARLVDSQHVELTVFMKRGMGIQGTVQEAGTSLALSNAPVRIKDIYGNPLRSATTDAAGGYVVGQALDSAQKIFVEATQPGYYWGRAALTPDPTSGDPDATVSLVLSNLPLPSFTLTNLNRAGLFLPGVNRAGNETSYSTDPVQAALTMTWTALVQAAELTYSRTHFHTPNGSPTGPRAYQHYDDIREVWFIDARTFVQDPYNETGVPLDLPDFSKPEEAQQWLRDIRDGTHPNVFHQRVRHLGETENPGEWTASGQVRLDQLPPGPVRPVFVAVTRGGAIAGTPYVYPTGTPSKVLRGVKMPPWMASVSDLISLISSTTGNNIEIGRTAPSGRFFPLPKFSSTIESTPEGFMKYGWDLKVRMLEGSQGPGDGLLGMGLGQLGISFHTGLNIQADGTTDSITLRHASTGRTPPLDTVDYIPRGATREQGKPQKPKNPSVRYGVTVGVDGSIQFAPDSYPNELQVTDSVEGFLQAKYNYDLTPYAGRLPYVGPPILLLKKAKLAALNAFLIGTVGVKGSRTWTTVFPRVEENATGGTIVLDPGKDQVYERTFVGGLQRNPSAQTNYNHRLDLCWNSGLGVEAKLHRVAGLRGGFEVIGNECNVGGLVTPIPSALIEPNMVGDWPPIRRLKGNLNIYLEAALRLWVVRMGKRWNWPFAPFDYQFNTDPVFSIVELDIANTLLTPSGAQPVAYQGDSQGLVRDFFPAGSWQTAGGSADTFLFTDTEPGTGKTLLKVALRSGDGTFGTPLAVATADAVAATDLAPLPGGGWMVVWTEIALENLGDPYPSSTIRFVTSNAAGTGWSSPAVVTSLVDVAAELRIVSTSTFTGLIYRHTAGGPLADRYSIDGVVFNGSTWGTPMSVAESVEVNGFDATGSGGSTVLQALVVYSDFAGNLFAHGWDGGTPSGAVAVRRRQLLNFTSM